MSYYPQTDPQYKLRIPPELKKQLEDSAKDSNRSMNAEIVLRLQQSFLNDTSVSPLEVLQKAEHFLAETMTMRAQVSEQLEKLNALLSKVSDQNAGR